MKLNLTDNQIDALRIYLIEDKQMCKKIEVLGYADLIHKIQAVIRLCRMAAYEIVETHQSASDEAMDIVNLLEIAEQFTALYDEMEALDVIRKELV